eukprot:6754913-Pyramimonas_sp.AAC.1
MRAGGARRPPKRRGRRSPRSSGTRAMDGGNVHVGLPGQRRYRWRRLHLRAPTGKSEKGQQR